MKKIVILALLLLAGIVWLFFNARIRVDIAAMRYDPNTQKLRLTYPPLIRSTSIPGSMQTGLVTLSDGESVKYSYLTTLQDQDALDLILSTARVDTSTEAIFAARFRFRTIRLRRSKI